jgi:hypothetical protein
LGKSDSLSQKTLTRVGIVASFTYHSRASCCAAQPWLPFTRSGTALGEIHANIAMRGDMPASHARSASFSIRSRGAIDSMHGCGLVFFENDNVLRITQNCYGATDRWSTAGGGDMNWRKLGASYAFAVMHPPAYIDPTPFTD